jgi:hypothetical protein
MEFQHAAIEAIIGRIVVRMGMDVDGVKFHIRDDEDPPTCAGFWAM